MSLTAAAASLIWAAASIPARERFRAALRDPRKAQHTLLRRYLHQNRDTAFGTAHGFAKILDAGRAQPNGLVAAYQERVPLTSYDDVEPLIARVAAGEAGVLTRARVDRLAPSSGSTSAAKLVPQTRDSSRELSRAVDAWIADLYLRRPHLMAGPSYWSITPAVSFESAAARFPGRHSATAVPVGFDDDSAYLGGMRRRLVDALLAVPPEVRRIADAGTFRYATLLFLVRARALRLMSVWHPSFLLQLIEGLPENADRIVHDLSRGGIDPPGPIDPSVRRALEPMLRKRPGRAAELRELSVWTARAVWPELAVISCWGDGAAKGYAARLGTVFPGVEVQRKGLIATEAIVSIPFADLHPLAIRSHFLEFIDGAGHARLAHDLQDGEEYSVGVTTGSGLYRYRLGDRVRVDGRVGATPSIEFVGRTDRVSDRYGEKLSDGFVASVLARLFTDAAPPRFAMLAPEVSADGVAYTLLVEPQDALPRGLAGALERELRQNPHYAWCVDLGQLRPARVVRVGPHADRAFLDACVARGQRLGDVKPVALHQESGWTETLGAHP